MRNITEFHDLTLSIILPEYSITNIKLRIAVFFYDVIGFIIRKLREFHFPRYNGKEQYSDVLKNNLNNLVFVDMLLYFNFCTTHIRML